MNVEDPVLFPDEEKAGPTAVVTAQADSGQKKKDEFRNYKNSKRQAVSSSALWSTLTLLPHSAC
jgi:hypothetical protein